MSKKSNFGFIGEVDPMHRLGARGDYPKLAPPFSSSCDSVTYKAGLGPAKNSGVKIVLMNWHDMSHINNSQQDMTSDTWVCFNTVSLN